MKHIQLLVVSLVLFCFQRAEGQNIVVSKGTIEMEIKQSRKSSRLVEDDGTTKCGYYSRETNTFFDCNNGNGEKVSDPSKIEDGSGCCRHIKLSTGDIYINGKLTIKDNIASISNSGVEYTINLADNKQIQGALHGRTSISITAVVQ